MSETYEISAGGKTYTVKSERPLSDADLKKLATQAVASDSQPQGKVRYKPGEVGPFTKGHGEDFWRSAKSHVEKHLTKTGHLGIEGHVETHADPNDNASPVATVGTPSQRERRARENFKKVGMRDTRLSDPDFAQNEKFAETLAREGRTLQQFKEGAYKPVELSLNNFPRFARTVGKDAGNTLSNLAGKIQGASLAPHEREFVTGVTSSVAESLDPRMTIPGEMVAGGLSSLFKKKVPVVEEHPNVAAGRARQGELAERMAVDDRVIHGRTKPTSKPKLKVVQGGNVPGVTMRPDTGKGRITAGARKGVENSTGHVTTEATLTEDLQKSLDMVKAKKEPVLASAPKPKKTSKQSGAANIPGFGAKPENIKAGAKAVGEYLEKVGTSVLGVTRTGQTIGDASATFRQGGYLFGKRGTTDAVKKSLNAITNPEVTAEVERMATKGANAKTYKKSGLFLATKGSEDPFIESALHKIPGVRPVIDASERHYNTFLNLQRMNAMDDFIKRYPKATLEELKTYASHINHATGRGDVDIKALNHIFYSPKFMVSRFQTTGDLVKATWHTATGRGNAATKEILKDGIRFYSTRSAILTAGVASGAWTIETNPKSGDFLKIKIGKRVFDPWAGQLQFARFMANLWKSDRNQANEALGRFLGNKMAPNVTLGWELKTGKDFSGKKTTPLASLGRGITPLGVQAVLETWKETEGNIPLTAGTGLAEFFGAGTGKSVGKGKSGDSGSTIPKSKNGISKPKFSKPKHP